MWLKMKMRNLIVTRERQGDYFFTIRQSLTYVPKFTVSTKLSVALNTPPTALPPFFAGSAEELRPSEILAVFPANTFLENIAVANDGTLFVTSLEEGIVYQIGLDGRKSVYAQTAGKLTGIVALPGQSFLVAGWDATGLATLYQLNKSKAMVPLIKPDGALFFNGMVALADNLFLVCDSYRGCIWQYELTTNRCECWLQHDLLARVDATNPMPAANGIKLFRGTVYVTNTAKQLLLKIPLLGMQAGEPEVFMRQLNLDDFVVDHSGNIYATTHIYNSVVKITPDKGVTIIGNVDQGLAGSTAVAFGQSPADTNCLYVTTNGGMSLPPAGGLQEARVVKLLLSAQPVRPGER